MNNVVLRTCPYCAADNEALPASKYSDPPWPIKECGQCGFVYLEVAPVYERLVEEFAWEKTSTAQTARRTSHEPVRKFISTRLAAWRRRWLKRDKLTWLVRRYLAPGNVLDVGCAAGAVMCNLPPIYAPHGIEISQTLAQLAQAQARLRGGYVVHDNALSGLREFPANYFSGILLSAFLEHETQPRELLREALRTLAPSGRCIIKVPNFASVNRVVRGRKWCGFRLPDHVNYFTPASLEGMCRAVGFHIERFTFADRLPTSDNMWIVIQKPEAPTI